MAVAPVEITFKGNNTNAVCEPVSLVTKMKYLEDPSHQKALAAGKSLSSFVSFAGNDATEEHKFILERIMNLSGYEDEVKENNVPRLHIRDRDDSYQYTICIQKSMWVLPNKKIEEITPERFASFDYMNRCQPVSCRVWEPGTDYEPEDEYTFRFTKSVIPYIYDLTIQFRVTEIDLDTLNILSDIDNLTIHKALLLERTKRDRTRVDSTRKVKSILMFHQLEEGILVSHITGVMNTVIPVLIANYLEAFHETVATEVAETAQGTRKYWLEEDRKKNTREN